MKSYFLGNSRENLLTYANLLKPLIVTAHNSNMRKALLHSCVWMSRITKPTIVYLKGGKSRHTQKWMTPKGDIT